MLHCRRKYKQIFVIKTNSNRNLFQIYKEKKGNNNLKNGTGKVQSETKLATKYQTKIGASSEQSGCQEGFDQNEEEAEKNDQECDQGKL